MRAPAAVASLALAISLSVAGCAPTPVAPPTSGPSPANTSARTYTVSAIDYHFHDAHPSLPIGLDQTVRFTNRGRNPHDVTFVDVEYREELPVGGEVVIEPIGSLVPGPGEYAFFCSYHRDRDMTGVLVIVPG